MQSPTVQRAVPAPECAILTLEGYTIGMENSDENDRRRLANLGRTGAGIQRQNNTGLREPAIWSGKELNDPRYRATDAIIAGPWKA